MLRHGLAGLLAALALVSPAAAADQVVTVTGFKFEPDTVNVLMRDTVTFNNPPSVNDHSLKWADRSQPSADGKVWTTSRTFNGPGTYRFYCTRHYPMDGTVTVVEQIHTWEGGDGAWTDAGKWEPEGVPGEGDLAVISGASTVTVPQDTTVGRLNLSGGATRGGPGKLTVTDGGFWNGASLTGGRTVIGKDGQVDASALTLGKNALDTVVLENDGTLVLDGDVLDGSFGASLLQNDGTVLTDGTLQIVPRLAHAGSMIVDGTLELKGGTPAPNPGDIWMYPDATLHVASGTYTAGPGAFIGGGRLLLGPGALTTQAGSALEPGVLELGGILTLDGTASVGTLRPGGGKRLGAGTMTVTGFAYTGNSLFDGPGVTIVHGDRTIAGIAIQLDHGHRMRFAEDLLVTPNATLLIGDGGGTFEVGGSLSLPSGRALGPSNGTGRMRILPGGSFAVPAGELLMTQVFESQGTTTIAGRLDAPNGAEVAGGTTTLSGTFTGGALHLTGGTLTGGGVSEEAVHVTGGTLAPAGSLGLAELHMTGGTLAVTLDGASAFSRVVIPGAQSTHLAGTLAVAGKYTPTVTDEFRVVHTDRLPDGTFSLVSGLPMKVRTDAAGAVLHGYVPPPVPPDPVTPDPGAPPPPSVTPTPLPRFGALVKLPRCAAKRRVRVQLLAPATVRALLGRRQLKSSARSFTLRRLPKRAFTLKFEVTIPDGRMVRARKRFRACKAS